MKYTISQNADCGSYVCTSRYTFGEGKIQAMFIVGFSILYLLRDIAGMVFPDIVFSGLCALAFVFANLETSFGIYIFTTTLTVPHNEIAIFYLVGVLLRMFLEKRSKINITLLVLTIGCLFLQMIDMMLFSPLNTSAFVYDYVVRMLPIVFPLLWFSVKLSPAAFKKALMCYVVGVLLGGTVTLILTGNDVGWDVLLEGTDSIRLGVTNEQMTEGMQTTYNANQLATMFTLSATISLLFMDQRWIPKALGYGIIAYSLLIILLTRSRSGMFTFLFAAMVYYWILIFRRKKVLQGIVALLALIIVVLVVINAFPGLLDGLLDRFVDQDDMTNGRADLFDLYISAWSADIWCLLFGYGIGSYSNVVDIFNVPHNSIADILISWGLVGFCLVITILGMLFKSGKKDVTKDNLILGSLPATIAIISSFAGQYLTVGFPHTRLCFLLLSINAFLLNNQVSLKPLED